MAGDLVLLTGATGFIGFRVLAKLLQSGYRVRAAVRNAEGFEKIKALKSAAPYASQLEKIIVPDITAPGAYDEAVKGVKYIIHVASPFASPDLWNQDHEVAYIQPAVRGTLGMLESANKVTGIERIVITASIFSIVAADFGGAEIINESTRNATTQGPFPHWYVAYTASKARAFEASKQWMAEHKPSFDVVNIEPVFVLGADETVTDPRGTVKGANSIIMGPLLGHAPPTVYPGTPVHVDDVATMHVRSLDRSIPGNEDYLAASHSLKGIEWASAFDIVKKHYPKECAEGIFKVDTMERPATAKGVIDSSKAEKTFGITFKSFEEQLLDITRQYLQLIGRA